mgnify:CR=1 FL=1
MPGGGGGVRAAIGGGGGGVLGAAGAADGVALAGAGVPHFGQNFRPSPYALWHAELVQVVTSTPYLLKYYKNDNSFILPFF